MSSLQSFEQEVADTTTPGFIMAAIGHDVCEGMRKAQWSVPGLRAICMLYFYERRQVVVEGEWLSVDQPHYLLHATYDRNGRDASMLIRFIDDNGESIRRVRDDSEPGSKAEKRQVDIHPKEAEWVGRLLLQAGIDRADQVAAKRAAYEAAVTSTPHLQVVAGIPMS